MTCKHCGQYMHTLNKLRKYHPECREGLRNQRRALTTTGAMTRGKIERIIAANTEKQKRDRKAMAALEKHAAQMHIDVGDY